MELLETVTKHEFLLEAPLQVLHEESREWLAEIDFWKDEAAFLFRLIIEKTKGGAVFLQTQDVKDAEKELITISAEKLEDMRLEVVEHEKFLARIMEVRHQDGHLYRSRHKEIVDKFRRFEQ
jgi:hypothetical protein